MHVEDCQWNYNAAQTIFMLAVSRSRHEDIGYEPAGEISEGMMIGGHTFPGEERQKDLEPPGSPR